MIEIKHSQDCCGCTACANICTHHAITMHPDTLGFLYPVVDKDKCTNCGLCEKVCVFNEHYDKNLNLPSPKAYAVRHKNIREIETSQSGAAFIAFSDWILNQGGIVYGVGYADHFRVVHKRATTKEERNEFKGSKYVQSDLNTVFQQVKEDLKNGLTVLFSGTPCQTSGLNSYIGKQHRNKLYLIDIICFGVPAPYIWRDYLSYQEKKNRGKITTANFRNKEKYGWASLKESFRFNNARIDVYADTYAYVFCQRIMFRHSCSICHFTNLQRPSDITIGDFWGYEKVDSAFNADNKGCSLVLCNTLNGEKWFDQIKVSLNYIPASLEDCLQPNLKHPAAIHPERINFEHDYSKKGFVFAMKKYGNIGFKYRLKYRLKCYKRRLKQVLNRLIGKS